MRSVLHKPGRPRRRSQRPQLAANYVLAYEGFHGCRCHCFVYHFGNVVLLQDPASNPGTSVTNMVAELMGQVCVHLRILPEHLRLVTTNSYEPDLFCLVMFIGAVPDIEWVRLPFTTIAQVREGAAGLPPSVRRFPDKVPCA